MTTATAAPRTLRPDANQRVRARRGVAAVATVTALSLTGVACSSLGAKNIQAQPVTASDQVGSAQGTAVDDKTEPIELAELEGADGAVLTVTSVQRKSGGFLTVKGRMVNTSDKPLNPMSWVAGNELVAKNPYSIAGATLADETGGKRYYILRDTDGLCLCTSFGPVFPAGRDVPVVMQFPAPPQGVQEVDLSVPTFDTASIRISG
ncbi:hypothetical protein [Streptomyces sp. NPDC005525]|uniref:hypothetical protein n=1 Tax=Streptomyces sp. NPDC005525 TaxID=3364720 RepID=UPI0036ACA1D7